MVNVLNMHNMKMIAAKRNGDFARKSINDNVAIPLNLQTTEIIRDQHLKALVQSKAFELLLHLFHSSQPAGTNACNLFVCLLSKHQTQFVAIGSQERIIIIIKEENQNK